MTSLMHNYSTTDYKRIAQNLIIDNSNKFERRRREKGHLYQSSSEYGPDFIGSIKCFENSQKLTTSESKLELQMGRKIRVNYFESRNDIDVHALGDKPYKYPSFSKNYFNRETVQKVNSLATVKTEKKGLGTLWKEKCKDEGLKNEIKDVEEFSEFANNFWNQQKIQLKKEREELDAKFNQKKAQNTKLKK